MDMCTHDPRMYQARLQRAVDAFDRPTIVGICRAIVRELVCVGPAYDRGVVSEHLDTLRRKRYFDLMVSIADTALRTGGESPTLRRQYAQALIDEGKISAALDVLRQILGDHTTPMFEFIEAKGLVGRCYKQIYMDAGANPTHVRWALRRAIETYLKVYQVNPREFTWHGINAAALILRARRDGLSCDHWLEPKRIAEDVREVLDPTLDSGMWCFATAAEACLILERLDEARALLRACVDRRDSDGAPMADAFEIASTHRQFVEVHQLDQRTDSSRGLIVLLENALIRRSGAHIEYTPRRIHQRVDAPPVDAGQLEKIFGDGGLASHQWFMRMFERALCVARIHWGDRGVGTGFVLPGEELSPAWSGRQVFLTNSHVASSAPGPQGYHYGSVRVTFDALDRGKGGPREYSLVEHLWESPAHELDTTVAALDADVECGARLRIARIDPRLADHPPPRMYVIGHPRGGELRYSFQDNHLVDINDLYAQYRSPTEVGNSGSPVFDSKWDLVAIHHHGSLAAAGLSAPTRRHAASQGVLLSALRQRIQADKLTSDAA